MTLRYMIWKIVRRSRFVEERHEFSTRCTDFKMPGNPPDEDSPLAVLFVDL